MPPRPAWSCRFTRHALRQSKACPPDRHDYASSPGMPSGSPKHASPTSMVMPVHPACPPTVQSPKHASPTGMVMPVHPACPPAVQSPKHAAPTGMVMQVHPACPPAVQSMPPRPAWSCQFTRHALRQSKACRPDQHGHAGSPGMPSGSPKHALPTGMVMPLHPACPPQK